MIYASEKQPQLKKELKQNPKKHSPKFKEPNATSFDRQTNMAILKIGVLDHVSRHIKIYNDGKQKLKESE